MIFLFSPQRRWHPCRNRADTTSLSYRAPCPVVAISSVGCTCMERSRRASMNLMSSGELVAEACVVVLTHELSFSSATTSLSFLPPVVAVAHYRGSLPGTRYFPTLAHILPIYVEMLERNDFVAALKGGLKQCIEFKWFHNIRFNCIKSVRSHLILCPELRVNITSTLNISRRPMSVRRGTIHFAASGGMLHDIVGPISVPSVGPDIAQTAQRQRLWHGGVDTHRYHGERAGETQ